MDKNPFWPWNDEEEVLGHEVPYLSAFGALTYLATHTKPDMSSSVNLLARYSISPKGRYWNGIKYIFRYLRRKLDTL